MKKRERIFNTIEGSALVARIVHKSYRIHCQSQRLVPSGFRCSNNVGSNVSNSFIIQATSERWHGILSVGYLSNDRFFAASSGKVLLKGFLLQSLLRHDDILSSGVASGAVGVENLLSIVNIASEGRFNGNSECNGTGSSSLSWKGVETLVYSHGRSCKIRKKNLRLANRSCVHALDTSSARVSYTDPTFDNEILVTHLNN